MQREGSLAPVCLTHMHTCGRTLAGLSSPELWLTRYGCLPNRVGTLSLGQDGLLAASFLAGVSCGRVVFGPLWMELGICAGLCLCGCLGLILCGPTSPRGKLHTTSVEPAVASPCGVHGASQIFPPQLPGRTLPPGLKPWRP